MKTIEAPPPPFANFRVYPDKQRYFYFQVLVFASRRQMREFVFRQNHPGASRRSSNSKRGDFDAITLPWERYEVHGNKSSKIERDIGQVVFFRQRTGTGCISHEMTHAALHYFKLKNGEGADFSDHKREELLALTIGDLTRQFYTRY